MIRRHLMSAALVANVLAGCALPQALVVTPAPTTVTANVHLAGKVALGQVDPASLGVLVLPSNAQPGAIGYTSKVDAEGNYGVDVPAGGDYTLTVKQNGNAVIGILRHVLGGPSNKLDVALTPTGSVHGTLQLAGPVAAVGVTVYVPGTSIASITDGSGAFALNNVPVSLTTTVRAVGVETSTKGFVDNLLSPSIEVTAGGDTDMSNNLVTTSSFTGPKGDPGAMGTPGAVGASALAMAWKKSIGAISNPVGTATLDTFTILDAPLVAGAGLTVSGLCQLFVGPSAQGQYPIVLKLNDKNSTLLGTFTSIVPANAGAGFAIQIPFSVSLGTFAQGDTVVATVTLPGAGDGLLTDIASGSINAIAVQTGPTP